MKDDRKKKTDRDDSVESVLYLLGQAWEMEHMQERTGGENIWVRKS